MRSPSAAILLFGTLILGFRAEIDLPAGFVPIHLQPAMTADDSIIQFCRLEHEKRAKDPPSYAMFRDLVRLSPCNDPAFTRSYKVAEVERFLDAESKRSEGSVGVDSPAGFVFHQARCGSTLVANMLAKLPEAVVYSESSPPPDIVLNQGFTDDEKIRLLQVVVRAMGRVEGVKRMFFKFQSALSPHMELIQRAFPATPWAYVQRDPVEVMASLLQTVRAAERAGKPVGEVTVSNSPCTRSLREPPAGVLNILGVKDRSAAMTVPTERYCAAHLAYLDTIALHNLEQHHPAGRARGAVVNYEAFPEAVVDLARAHFGQELSAAEEEAMLSVTDRYSKDRSVHGGGKPRYFSGDGEQKQQTAPESVKRWASAYVAPLHAKLDRYTPGSSSSPSSSSSSSASARQAVAPFEQPYPRVFPMVDILDDWNMDDIRVPDHAVKEMRYSSLRVFDYQTEQAEALRYREAEVPFVLRGVTNLVELNERWSDEYLSNMFGNNKKGVEKSVDNHFMYYNKLSPATRTKHYDAPTESMMMTFDEWAAKADAIERDIRLGKLDNREATHYYFRASARQGGKPHLRGELTSTPGRDNSFIADQMTIFRPEPSLFIKDADFQRGIHCRFGMAGILAESHYDAGRNYVVMVRGRRRYILNPPDQCKNLDILLTGPSARHTKSDWSNPKEYHKSLKNAKGLEVVLEPGDALYIPSLWFHSPVSLTRNIQCNSRSGSPPEGALDIHDCGFPLHITEGLREGKTTPYIPAVQPFPAPTPPPKPAAHDPLFNSLRWDEEARTGGVEFRFDTGAAGHASPETAGGKFSNDEPPGGVDFTHHPDRTALSGASTSSSGSGSAAAAAFVGSYGMGAVVVGCAVPLLGVLLLLATRRRLQGRARETQHRTV